MGCLLSLPGIYNIPDETVYVHYKDLYSEDPYEITDEYDYQLRYYFCD